MYEDRSRTGKILTMRHYVGCFLGISNSTNLDLSSGYQGLSTFKIQPCKTCLL